MRFEPVRRLTVRREFRDGAAPGVVQVHRDCGIGCTCDGTIYKAVPHDRYHAEPVYDVHDCGPGQHDRYISGWDVVNSEGIYEAGPFDSEPEAAEEAQRLNAAAKLEQEAMCAGHQQHNVRAEPPP